MWHFPHASATFPWETFDSGFFVFRTEWLPWQSWQRGAFGFPFAIALPWAESMYARTLSDWGAPSLFPLKWQWVHTTRLGCSRWGISATSKWQSVHTFFSCTEPFRVSAVAKRSRTWPATRSLRNSGFPWHSVHFSSEIAAPASGAPPGRSPPPKRNTTAARTHLLITALPL